MFGEACGPKTLQNGGLPTAGLSPRKLPGPIKM